MTGCLHIDHLGEILQVAWYVLMAYIAIDLGRETWARRQKRKGR